MFKNGSGAVAVERRRAREVDVVADQHEVAALVRAVEAAGRVREHDRARAGGRRQANEVGHGLRRVTLIEMGPARESDDPFRGP
jgi:hypothetical protein